MGVSFMWVPQYTLKATYGRGMLTDSEIKTAKPKEKVYKFADSGGLFYFCG